MWATFAQEEKVISKHFSYFFQKLKTHVQQVEKMRVHVTTLPPSLFSEKSVRTMATCAHPDIYAHNHTLKPPELPVKIRNQSARVISYA